MSVFLVILLLIMDFFLTCGLLWLITVALGWIGITVAFSWKIACAVWVIIVCLRALFK